MPQIGDEERRLVAAVLDSNFVNEGEITAQFEEKLSELLGSKHVVTVTSGTSALFLALVGLGVRKGDEVIVPDVTFIATANAVTMTGANPVLVDIDPSTLNIDPEAMGCAITTRTKAVIPVHVSGRAANLPAVMEVAEGHGIYVVEDAAEGLMSQFNGKYLGTFGKAGCLSFSPNKTITTGQGGAILTDDDELAGRLRELKDQGRPVRGTGGDDSHPRVGYNFKFTNLQAALGLGQLSYLEFRLTQMKKNYRRYAKELSGLKGISLLGFSVETGESPQWVDVLVERRNDLEQFLREKGVNCRRFWLPVHTQAPYRLPDDDFPNSTRVIPHAMWLPSAFTLSGSDVETICGYIREFVETTQ